MALGLVALHVYVKSLPGLEAAEGLTIDGRFRLRGPRAPASDRVVVVGIDDETRARHPEVLQTRRGYADLIRALAKYDVKVIALDLFFSSPEVILPDELEADVRKTAAEMTTTRRPIRPRRGLRLARATINEELRGDEMLATAIAESKRVFLGAYFVGGPSPSGEEPAKLKLARHGEAADSGGGGFRRPVHAVLRELHDRSDREGRGRRRRAQLRIAIAMA